MFAVLPSVIQLLSMKRAARKKPEKSFDLFYRISVLITAVIIAKYAQTYLVEIYRPTQIPTSEKSAFNKSVQPTTKPSTNSSLCVTKILQPKYCLLHSRNDLGILKLVKIVLDRLGLQQVFMNATDPKTFHNNWDLMWTFDNLRKFPLHMDQIQFHQKVNHLPGNYHLCSKSVFGRETDSKYVPKAFMTVDAVKNYLKTHPGKRFVVKRKSNRGVILQDVAEMNFTYENSQHGFFANEYVEDPLLFNGHKFDFAVYVVVTSLNPLRLYYYTKNVILRFCPKTYNTSDPEDRDRYVVRSSHIPGSEFPGIEEFFRNDYTYREGFNAFLRSLGPGTVEKVWREVENLIRTIVLSREKLLIEEINKTGVPKYSFFEMFRFDLILDKHLNLYVLEVNQSPNLYPDPRHLKNEHVYQSVLFNLFNLIGVGKPYMNENFIFASHAVESMVAHKNSLTVRPETCMNHPCNETCEATKCDLCWNCLKDGQIYEMRQAYLEQKSSGDMKRLFPPTKDSNIENDFLESLGEENRLHLEWFNEMCDKDHDFC